MKNELLYCSMQRDMKGISPDLVEMYLFYAFWFLGSISFATGELTSSCRAKIKVPCCWSTLLGNEGAVLTGRLISLGGRGLLHGLSSLPIKKSPLSWQELMSQGLRRARSAKGSFAQREPETLSVFMACLILPLSYLLLHEFLVYKLPAEALSS